MEQITNLPMSGVAQGLALFIGQNIGARKEERIVPGERAALKASLLTSFILVACLILFGRYLIMMFTDTPDIINLGTRSLRILAVGVLAQGVALVWAARSSSVITFAAPSSVVSSSATMTCFARSA